jgi:hypothetical protein
MKPVIDAHNSFSMFTAHDSFHWAVGLCQISIKPAAGDKRMKLLHAPVPCNLN